MPLTSIAEFLDPANNHAPTTAERNLIAAVRAGEGCILNDGTRPTAASDGTHIRADLLHLLILGGTKDCGLHDSGVWLEGGYITGMLDLRFAKARGQCVLDSCHFVEEPNLTQTKLPQLSLEGSQLPGLFAQGVKITGSLFLRNLIAAGTVYLSGAQIGRQLACEGAKLDGAGSKALNAQRITTGESLFLSNLTATGTVDVNGAQIGGQLTCTGATLNGAGNKALNAQGITTGDNLFLSNLTATGTVDVNGAQIGGQLDCEGAKLDGAGGDALNAQRVITGESLFLRNLTATGTVDVNGAQIGGQLACEGAKLDGAGGDALNAQRVTTGESLFLRNLTATGTVDLNGAQVGGQFDCEGAKLDGAGGDALNAQSMRVSDGFLWRDVSACNGEMNLNTAHAATLVDDPESWAKVSSLNLDGFTYDRITASPTDAKTRLSWLRKGSITDGQFSPQPYTQLAKVLRAMGHASDARKVLMEGQEQAAQHLRMLDRKTCELTKALRNLSREQTTSHVQAVSNVISEVPAPLDEFLKASIEVFHLLNAPQINLPNGPPPLSETTMALARQDFRNQMFWAAAKARMRIGWSYVKDFALRRIIGYGHAPERAIAAMIWVILPFAMFFHQAYSVGGMVPNSDVVLTSPSWYWAMLFDSATPTLVWDKGATAKHYETFYALAYAFDAFVPIVDLGQQSAWSATTVSWWGWSARIATMVLEVIGWIITALAAASITGLVQKNQPD